MAKLLERRKTDALPVPEEVLSRAIARLAGFWQLTNAQLARIIGVSPATASRLRSGAWQLEPGSKPLELSQYLLRLFRSLDAMMGSDDAASISWLRAENMDLGARPIDLIQTVSGLMDVCNYVDDFRAHV